MKLNLNYRRNTRFGQSEISKGLGKYKSIIKYMENLYQSLIANRRIGELESFLDEANSFEEEFKMVLSELLSHSVDREIRNQFNIPYLILQNKYFEIIKNIKNFILLLKKYTVYLETEKIIEAAAVHGVPVEAHLHVKGLFHLRRRAGDVDQQAVRGSRPHGEAIGFRECGHRPIVLGGRCEALGEFGGAEIVVVIGAAGGR